MKHRMQRFHRIVVGIDFSEASAQALEEAVRFARCVDGEVCALHVIDIQVLQSLEQFSRMTRKEVVANVTAQLQKFCEAGIESGRVKHTAVRVGHPVKAFTGYCDEYDPGLIVLGAWGSRGAADHASGTTAKHIAQESRVDVLILHPRIGNGFCSVLACVDFSPFDDAVIKAAGLFCHCEQHASLEILHLYFPPWQRLHSLGQAPAAPDEDTIQEYRSLLRGRLEESVKQSLGDSPGFGIRKTVLESELHADGILDHAVQANVDLTVVGARGSSRIDSMILGRIAERVVTESTSSVYLVKVT